MWNEHLKKFNDTPHKIRQIPLNEENFLKDIDYRIKILKIVEASQVDGFYAIKSILETIYNLYFNSDLFKNTFSLIDQKMIEYMTAREILGNLIQYNKMDHETVPLKYNIMARNYLLIKLKGQVDVDILENMKKLNLDLDLVELDKIMDEIVADGLINKEKQEDKYFYKLEKELKLSEEGEIKFNESGIRAIIQWPTQFWRSFYNLRELNITVEENVKHRDFLHQILSKSATQGFGPTNFVIKNLIKYFEKIKETQ
ncbi:MAG: hypothetical protein EU529_04585 [Promethearchaeota archaeon]|nr:MAG: hypothetical protein EU529_04585 [Candidatus Lokiarchaeota archaeon]